MVSEVKLFGSALLQVAELLAWIAVEHRQHGGSGDDAVVVTKAKRFGRKKKWPDFSKPASAPSSLVRRLM